MCWGAYWLSRSLQHIYTNINSHSIQYSSTQLNKTYATPWGASACTKTSKVTLSSSINPFSGSVTSYKIKIFNLYKNIYTYFISKRQLSLYSALNKALLQNCTEYFFKVPAQLCSRVEVVHVVWSMNPGSSAEVFRAKCHGLGEIPPIGHHHCRKGPYQGRSGKTSVCNYKVTL